MSSRIRYRHHLIQSSMVLLMLLAACPLLAATNVKLSGAMPAFGDVHDFRISPNGRYAVYLADRETDHVNELYSVRISGGSPIRLSPIVQEGQGVLLDFQISPDSSRVVYRAVQDSYNTVELYSVPIGGPANAGIKLNGLLAIVEGVESFFQTSSKKQIDSRNVLKAPVETVSGLFLISPDSNRVVFIADQQNTGVKELYSVPIEGPAGAGIKLNNSLVVGGSIITFQISPDSNRVVYMANQDSLNVTELYSVPIGGPSTGTGIKLNGFMVAGGDVGSFIISPDSTRVVYHADKRIDTVNEIFSVPLQGPPGGIILNPPLTGNKEVNKYQISPDSSRVVYMSDQGTNDVRELYSVPLAGPWDQGVKLNNPLQADRDVYDFAISPDSTRVVYLADRDTKSVLELFSVPLAGPWSHGVKLNGPLAWEGDVTYFQITPDSTRVVYWADQDTNNTRELYSVPINGPSSSVLKLNKMLVAGGEVGSFMISPDSTRVVYQADQDTNDLRELYGVPIEGPADAGMKLNGPLSLWVFINKFQISPDNLRVLYTADQDTDELRELYMTPGYFIHLPLIRK